MNMASFAGNIGFKFSCPLQCRVLSITRAIWNCRITCLKCRDHRSSVPLRDMSNASSKVTIFETANALPMKSLEISSCASHPNISALKINGGKNVHGRFVHCEASQNMNEVDNNLLFEDSDQDNEQLADAEEAVEELRISQMGDCCQQKLLQTDRHTIDAEKSAIKLLATRALTTVELRKKLHGKRFSPDTVEAVINKFRSRGLINDRLYSEAFSRSRWSSSSWGPRRIKQVPHHHLDRVKAKALYKKGVSQTDTEKAVEVVFKDDGGDEDEKLSFGMSKHSMDHLYVQASKQWLRGQDVPKETRKSRIVRWLQYRGFDWDVINFILGKLDRQGPP